MKREIKIEIKDDLNHYALIMQKNNRENETDYGMLIDKDQYEQLRQHAVSGSLPLPELVKELGECLEQSSVLIDFGAARCQDDFSVPAHLQRVKEARQLYKFYKESGGNDH